MQARAKSGGTPVARNYAGSPCHFCNSAEENELLLGKFHYLEDIVVHYYCLLLSPNIAQNGEDDEGILGFLAHDIRKELSRGKRLRCKYCKEKGATLGCCNPKCKTMFHLPCGIENGSLHQFFGQFMSFCKNHRPLQKASPQIIAEAWKQGAYCGCCIEPLEPRPSLSVIWAPCCKKSSFFHRDCIQQFALSAGYFFRCPLCNNRKLFSKTMAEQGIFVPERDASWELEPGAYHELYVRPNECVASQCNCPNGRNFCAGGKKKSMWTIKPCDSCGSKGIHIECGMLNLHSPKWDCKECLSMLSNSKTEENSKMEEDDENKENIEVDDNVRESAKPDVKTEDSNNSSKKKSKKSISTSVAELEANQEDSLKMRRVSLRLRRRSAQTIELPTPRRRFTRSAVTVSMNCTIELVVPSGSEDTGTESLSGTPQESLTSSRNSDDQSSDSVSPPDVAKLLLCPSEGVESLLIYPNRNSSEDSMMARPYKENNHVYEKRKKLCMDQSFVG